MLLRNSGRIGQQEPCRESKSEGRMRERENDVLSESQDTWYLAVKGISGMAEKIL